MISKQTAKKGRKRERKMAKALSTIKVGVFSVCACGSEEIHCTDSSCLVLIVLAKTEEKEEIKRACCCLFRSAFDQ